MTHPMYPSKLSEEFQSLAEHGFDGMAAAMEVLLNECMRIARQQALGAGPYQRSDDRRGNGFKPKHVKTRIGELERAVPQVRGMKFYPAALERGPLANRRFYRNKGTFPRGTRSSLPLLDRPAIR
jgi:hypothetical protein